MNEPFHLGEIAILKNAGVYTGQEVTIVGLLKDRNVLHKDGVLERTMAYAVELKGEIRAARHYQLQKKPPPRFDLIKVSWKSCPWKPRRVRA